MSRLAHSIILNPQALTNPLPPANCGSRSAQSRRLPDPGHGSGGITMRLSHCLVAVALSTLLALPAAGQTPSPSKSPNAPATATSKQTGKSEQDQLVDINSASAEELDKLPGVGPARAKAIIANRPYNGKDDLTQRKIIPPNVYNQIKDKVIARQK